MRIKRLYPVVFVGAGPGDPELITVKGQKALTDADLILYAGSLVSETLLELAKPGAEIVDTAPLGLEAILSRIIHSHREGKRVVRLQSGDPGLFSAMQEQVDALQREGIPCRVIPGVTAASAVSAALAQELTLPEVTQTVILTRAAGRTPVPDREALSQLARHGATLAIYLSVHQIESVVAALVEGYGQEAPVVVAYRVSWPQERILRATLSTIAERVRKAGIQRQALILVGPALESREECARPRSRLYHESFSHGFRSGS
jgi:precorrin-4/cobalt-precorrin-4 C11-methyltransferase